MNVDWIAIITGITVIGFVYSFLRNFKNDINSKIDRMENRIDQLEERMFLLATGRKLQDVILEERLKNSEEPRRKEL